MLLARDVVESRKTLVEELVFVRRASDNSPFKIARSSEAESFHLGIWTDVTDVCLVRAPWKYCRDVYYATTKQALLCLYHHQARNVDYGRVVAEASICNTLPISFSRLSVGNALVKLYTEHILNTFPTCERVELFMDGWMDGSVGRYWLESWCATHTQHPINLDSSADKTWRTVRPNTHDWTHLGRRSITSFREYA